MASLLGKNRIPHNTFYGMADSKSSKPGAAAAMFAPKHGPRTAGEKCVVAVYPALPDHIYGVLGHIAARWPILELYIDEMTKLLTVKTGGDPEMKGVYNAKKRISYHEEQFSLAFQGHQRILAYHHEIMKLIRRVKRVRDYVGHAQIVGQSTEKGFTVRFVDHTMNGNREPKYTSDDLMKIASDISHAAGYLESLATADSDVLPFSSSDISALQDALGADRWNKAIGLALKIPPQSSPA